MVKNVGTYKIQRIWLNAQGPRPMCIFNYLHCCGTGCKCKKNYLYILMIILCLFYLKKYNTYHYRTCGLGFFDATAEIEGCYCRSTYFTQPLTNSCNNCDIPTVPIWIFILNEIKLCYEPKGLFFGTKVPPGVSLTPFHSLVAPKQFSFKSMLKCFGSLTCRHHSQIRITPGFSARIKHIGHDVRGIRCLWCY